MRPIITSVGPLVTANASNIAHTQTPTSGTALTLNGSLVTGGAAILDKPRQVLLTYGSEGSARTLVVTGTTFGGQPATETLAIPSGTVSTVATVLDYTTVTSLVPLGGGWTTNVTVGTNTVAGSPWIFLDSWAMPQISLQVNVTGTVNYTIQQTLDDPNSPWTPVTPVNVTWVNSPDAAVVGATSSAQSNYAYVPSYTRVVLNSGSGSITYTVIQADA
jgi:hypothetical protein